MHKLIQYSVFTVLLYYSPIMSFSATINVPSDQPTIQDGINAAVNGDTVLVAAGYYVESINFSGKMIKVLSSDGPELTTIQAPENSTRAIVTSDGGDTTLSDVREYEVRSDLSVVEMISGEPKGAEISGFTINGGGNSGIRCENSSPTITKNIIVGNFSIEQNQGAGIDMLHTTAALIKGNIFQNNTAFAYGAGIHLEFSNDDTVCYNLFHDNYGYGEIRSLNAYSIYYNNTIFPTTWSGVLNQHEGIVDVRNNIVMNSPVYGIQAASEGQIVAGYNCTWDIGSNDYQGTVPGIGAIYEDPLLIDPANGNYKIQSESPCKDAGDPAPFFNDQDGSRNDIGAYPDDTPYIRVLSVSYGPEASGNEVYSLSPTISWSYYDSQSESQIQYQIQVGTDEDWTIAELWDSGPVLSSETSANYDGLPLLTYLTHYFLRLRVNNGSVWSDWYSSWFYSEKTYRVRDINFGPTAIDNEITTLVPEIFWSYLDLNETSQEQYQIQVGTDENWTVAEMWDSGPVVSTSSLSIYAGSELSYNTIYYIRIRAFNGSDWTNWYSSWFFNPRTFEVRDIYYDPAENDNEITTLTPEILWTYFDSEGTTQTQYQIQIGTDEDWTVAEMWDTGPISSSVSNAVYSGLSLSYNVVYYLRIRVNDGTYWSDWSSSWFHNPRTFDVRDINYGPTSINNEITTLTPEIFWTYFDTEGSTQTQFQIQVGIDEDWTVAEMWDSGPISSPSSSADYSGLPLSYNVVYYLRIRASDGTYWTEWASSWFHNPRTFEVRGISFGPSSYGNTVTTLTPEIDWTYFDTEGSTQIQYQIQVGTDEDWATAELWDTGPIISSSAQAIYDGLTLEAENIYYLRIRAFDGYDWTDWTTGWFFVHFASIIYVPQNFGTIQAGVAAALDGDKVLVASGLYSENIEIISKSVIVESADGATSTSIEPADMSQPTITIANCTGITGLIGFSVINGGTNRNHGNLDIFSNTDTTYISNNIFHSNSVGANNNNPIIRSSSISYISYNLFYGNGGINCIWTEDVAYVINNTIDNNSRGLLCLDGNTIALNNIVTNSFEYGVYGTYNTLAYNDVWGNGTWNQPGINGISEDPQYVDPLAFDYNIQLSSPCRDAGDPDLLYNDIDGTRNDMGAFPILFNMPFARDINYGDLSAGHTVKTLQPDFYWTYYDINPTYQVQYQIQVGTDDDWNVAEMWDSGPVVSSEGKAAYAGLPLNDFTQYYLRIRLFDGTDWGGWVQDYFIVHSASVIYIPQHFQTIQAGIDAAVDFDTILVSPGTYVESIDFLGKSIRVLSLVGPEVTTIRAPGSAARTIITSEGSDTTISDSREYTINSIVPVVSMTSGEPKGAELSGFTITGGGHSGIRCENSSPTITDNIIVGNYSDAKDDGAGINMFHTTSSLIKGNVIHDNTAHTYGAGIHMESSTDDTVCYNLLYGNIGYGDLRSLEAHSIFHNNTIVPQIWCGILNQRAGTVKALNNIVTDSPVHGIQAANDGTIVANYNCTWNIAQNDYYGTSPGSGAIYEDPLFIDQAHNNYEIPKESPCKDAGDPDPLFNDLDGTRNDIGAFPNLYNLPFASNFNYGELSIGHTVISLEPSFYWTYYDNEPTSQVQYQIQVGTDDDWNVAEMWDSGPVVSSEGEAVYAGTPLAEFTRYYLRIRLFDGSDWGGWVEDYFIVRNGLGVIHIPGDFETIQEGIDEALPLDTVLVAPGVYYNNLNFLGKSIVVTSEKGPRYTHIRPSYMNESNIIFDNGEGPGAVLRGFTIKGGGAVTTVICGVGCEPTIENNIFRNNIPDYYEGLAVIKADDHALIRYNLFYDNHGMTTIWSTDNAEVINNTIVNNVSGIYAEGSETIIRNNIITNNNYYGVFGNLGHFDYNDVWNNNSGNKLSDNGLSVDPIYVDAAADDFNMRQTSPCVDAGDPDPFYNDINGTRNDMGALPFIYCGDIDLDNEVSISDVVYLINYYFAGGSSPKVLYKSDVNCDDNIGLTDIVYMSTYVLSNGSVNCCY